MNYFSHKIWNRIAYLTLFVFLCVYKTYGQQAVENIIIITTDGYRWQEMFQGMDSALAANSKYNNENESHLFDKYWVKTPEERRRKLMPFIWTELLEKGQIYGNHQLNVKVKTANPYWFSYPGYSEIFCGYVDKKLNSNDYPDNPNTNLLEYINKQEGFKGKVAVFGAWNAFSRILNEQRSGIPVVCGGDSCGGINPDKEEKRINREKRNCNNPFDSTEYPDIYTHQAAMHYFKKNKPRVLYVSYGETDEWAHSGQYATYLNTAHQVDEWIKEWWTLIQNDPKYKDKTALFITVDHGRGDKIKDEWRDHNRRIKGSNEIWFVVAGPNIPAKGEINKPLKLYQEQFAQTMANMLGFTFNCEHKVGKSFFETLTRIP